MSYTPRFCDPILFVANGERLYTKPLVPSIASVPPMAFSLSPEFLKSAQKPTQFPADSGREVAFSGRSNSGKSSAINAITARRSLARTSKTPGRTQLINFFEIDETLRLVDLPGYGYAKVAAAVRQEWRVLLEAYFRERASLVGLFITVDVRRGLNDLDQVMLSWSREADVAAAILLTKADKLSRSARLQRRRVIAMTLPEDVPLILFSAPGRLGLDEAREQLLLWLGKAGHREISQ
jgi:GTP-binding protein